MSDDCMWCRYGDHPDGPFCPKHGWPEVARDNPSEDAIILLENEIALGRRHGAAGQVLDAMCTARDEIARLEAHAMSAEREIARLREALEEMRQAEQRWVAICASHSETIQVLQAALRASGGEG